MTYLLVVLGSTVRVTHSGMGCPSWPLCYGHLGYVDRFHAILEQSHRFMASVVTAGIVGTAAGVERRGRSGSGRRLGSTAGDGFPSVRPCGPLRKLTRWSVVLVGVQVVLGAITVFAHNAPWTVAVHLVAAFVLLGVVTAVAATAVRYSRRPATGRSDFRPGGGRFAGLGWAAVVALLATVASGAGVVDSGVAARCRSVPLCPGGTPAAALVPNAIHRTIAATAVVLVVAAALRALLGGGSQLLALATMGLAGVQVVAGAAVAVLGAPAVMQDVHLAIAAALWASAVSLVVSESPGRGWRSPALAARASRPPR